MSRGNQSVTSSTRTFMPPNMTKDEKSVPRRFKLGRANLAWILVALLVVISGFLYSQYRAAQHKLHTTPSAEAKAQQINNVISQVGKLIILPKGETPTVATIVNADKLHDQAFFAQAKNGDKVLVYSQTKQAFLYRPSTNQLVNVAPLSVTPNGGVQPSH